MTLLTTEELSQRWKLHAKTLPNWRVKKIGPAYIKLGEGKKSKVLYRIEDVVAFETGRIVGEPVDLR